MIKNLLMRKIYFYTQNEIVSNSGFTLVECVMSLVILSLVLLTMLYAVNLANKSNQYTDDVYKSGMMLEGIMAEARLIAAEEILSFSDEEQNNIWELITNNDIADTYDFLLLIENTETGKTYTFTSNPDLEFSAEDFNLLFNLTMPGGFPVNDSYDLIIDSYTPVITISESIIDNYYIAVNVHSNLIIEIESPGNCHVFVDIYGECPISYKGRGLLVERQVSSKNPIFLIYGVVYSENAKFLNHMALAKGDDV